MGFCLYAGDYIPGTEGADTSLHHVRGKCNSNDDATIVDVEHSDVQTGSCGSP